MLARQIATFYMLHIIQLIFLPQRKGYAKQYPANTGHVHCVSSHFDNCWVAYIVQLQFCATACPGLALCTWQDMAHQKLFGLKDPFVLLHSNWSASVWIGSIKSVLINKTKTWVCSIYHSVFWLWYIMLELNPLTLKLLTESKTKS